MSASPVKPYILVVEDEEALALLTRYNLEKEGYEVKCVNSGTAALEAVEERIPDLIVLDWMLPGMNGIEVCQEIRALEYTKDLPVIMLTARSQEADRLKGFITGADDYMTKPFSPKELSARIKSILKRAKPSLLEAEISYGEIKVDNNRKCIFARGHKLALTPLEYALLHYMVSKPEKVYSRDQLLRHVWGENETNVESRTVDVCIRRIRAELERVAPEIAEMVKTVRGEGYLLEKN